MNRENRIKGFMSITKESKSVRRGRFGLLLYILKSEVVNEGRSLNSFIRSPIGNMSKGSNVYSQGKLVSVVNLIN